MPLLAAVVLVCVSRGSQAAAWSGRQADAALAVRSSLLSALGLAEGGGASGQCLPEQRGTRIYPAAGVAEVQLADAARAVAALASARCLDAALSLARVIRCAQSDEGMIPSSLFVPVPAGDAGDQARAFRGIAAALAAGAQLGHVRPGLRGDRAQQRSARGALRPGDGCVAALGLVLPAGRSRQALDDAWPSSDAAWPSAGFWAQGTRGTAGDTVIVTSGLAAPAGLGRHLSLLADAAQAPAAWGPPRPASRGEKAPAAWTVSEQVRAWFGAEGAGAVLGWVRFLSRNRTIALAAGGASRLPPAAQRGGVAPPEPPGGGALLATAHAWEGLLPLGPGHTNFTALAPPCNVTSVLGRAPSWWVSAAGPAAVPGPALECALCALRGLRGGAAGRQVHRVDPALTAHACLDAAAAARVASRFLVPGAQREAVGALRRWRLGLRSALSSGALLALPGGGAAFAPMSWDGMAGRLESTGEADGAGVAVLAALPLLSVSDQDGSTQDTYNASAWLPEDPLPAQPVPWWAVSLAEGAAAAALAPAGLPTASLSALSPHYAAASGQRGPLWMHLQPALLAAGRAASATTMLLAASEASLQAASASNASGWAAAFETRPSGLLPLAGSGGETYAVGLLSAAELLLARREHPFAGRACCCRRTCTPLRSGMRSGPLQRRSMMPSAPVQQVSPAVPPSLCPQLPRQPMPTAPVSGGLLPLWRRTSPLWGSAPSRASSWASARSRASGPPQGAATGPVMPVPPALIVPIHRCPLSERAPRACPCRTAIAWHADETTLIR